MDPLRAEWLGTPMLDHMGIITKGRKRDLGCNNLAYKARRQEVETKGKGLEATIKGRER